MEEKWLSRNSLSYVQRAVKKLGSHGSLDRGIQNHVAKIKRELKKKMWSAVTMEHPVLSPPKREKQRRALLRAVPFLYQQAKRHKTGLKKIPETIIIE